MRVYARDEGLYPGYARHESLDQPDIPAPDKSNALVSTPTERDLRVGMPDELRVVICYTSIIRYVLISYMRRNQQPTPAADRSNALVSIPTGRALRVDILENLDKLRVLIRYALIAYMQKNQKPTPAADASNALVVRPRFPISYTFSMSILMGSMLPAADTHIPVVEMTSNHGSYLNGMMRDFFDRAPRRTAVLTQAVESTDDQMPLDEYLGNRDLALD